MKDGELILILENAMFSYVNVKEKYISRILSPNSLKNKIGILIKEYEECDMPFNKRSLIFVDNRYYVIYNHCTYTKALCKYEPCFLKIKGENNDNDI